MKFSSCQQHQLFGRFTRKNGKMLLDLNGLLCTCKNDWKLVKLHTKDVKDSLKQKYLKYLEI